MYCQLSYREGRSQRNIHTYIYNSKAITCICLTKPFTLYFSLKKFPPLATIFLYIRPEFAGPHCRGPGQRLLAVKPPRGEAGPTAQPGCRLLWLPALHQTRYFQNNLSSQPPLSTTHQNPLHFGGLYQILNTQASTQASQFHMLIDLLSSFKTITRERCLHTCLHHRPHLNFLKRETHCYVSYPYLPILHLHLQLMNRKLSRTIKNAQVQLTRVSFSFP